VRETEGGNRVRVAAAEHLPFASQQFDIVVAITILCFVEDSAPVFREMARVLRPGGRLVIGELGRWSSWAAARRHQGIVRLGAVASSQVPIATRAEKPR
jgi:ubiquinone/menaquinone biosynthesis C-methylase UbiE